MNGRKVRFAVPGDGEPMLAVAFAPDGRTLAAGSADGKVRLWDMGALLRSKPD